MSIKKNAYQEQQYFSGIRASRRAVNPQNCFAQWPAIHCNHGTKHQYGGGGNLRRPTSLGLQSRFASNSKGPFENDSRVFSMGSAHANVRTVE